MIRSAIGRLALEHRKPMRLSHDNRLGVEWKWTFGVSIEDGAAIRSWSNALEQSRAPLRQLISALE